MKTLLKSILRKIRDRWHGDINGKIEKYINQIDANINQAFGKTNERLLNSIKKIVPHSSLAHFEIHLTDHCNLNCWGCSHFSPLADKAYLNLDSYEADMKRIYELSSGNIVSINLQGGEPLLHPDLIRIFEISRSYFSDSIIRLITNGLLLSYMEKDFWIAAKINNIFIAPTKYPINVSWDDIENIAAQYEVKMYYYNSGYHSGKGSYKETMMCTQIDIEGKQYQMDSYLNCFQGNRCIQLRNGRFYTCAIAAYAEYFIKYFNLHLRISDADSIDIYKATNMQEILEFLARPIPFCRYCRVDMEPYYHVWQISEKKITEWTGI